MSITKRIVGAGAAFSIAAGGAGCSSPETKNTTPTTSPGGAYIFAPKIETGMTSDDGIHLRLIGAETVNSIYTDEPEGYAEQKDGMWEALLDNSPGLHRAIIEKMGTVTNGLYKPRSVSQEMAKTTLEVQGCMDISDEQTIEAIQEIAPPPKQGAINAFIINAELCPIDEGTPQEGVAIFNEFALVGRSAFTEHADITRVLGHEIMHFVANSLHAGVAECESPSKVTACAVTAENDTTAALMSYAERSYTPYEYQSISAVDAYKAGLINQRVVSDVAPGTSIELTHYSRNGIAMIKDTNTAGQTVYISAGPELSYSCRDEQSPHTQDERIIAVIFPPQQAMKTCYSSKDDEPETVVRTYVDVLSEEIDSISHTKESTAVIDSKPGESVNKGEKPFVAGFTEGVVLETDSKRYVIDSRDKQTITIKVEAVG